MRRRATRLTRRRLVSTGRRGLSALGHAAIAGLGAGALTYGTLRLGGRIARPLAHETGFLARRVKPLAAELREFGKHRTAINWGLGNGLVAASSAFGAWKKRRRRRR